MAAAERREPAPERMSAEEFCTAYYDRVVGLAVHAFGRADAHDVAHEALWRMLVSYDSLDPSRDAWPWVATIVRNAGRQCLRQRRPVVALEAADAAAPDGAFEAVAAREERRTLARALDRMPPSDRAVLLMRVRDELPFAEIARRTGRTPGALRVQAVRARQRLAEEFARLGGTAYGVGVLVSARAARLRERLAGLAAAWPSAAQVAVAAVVCGGLAGGGAPAAGGTPPPVARGAAPVAAEPVARPARADAPPVGARAVAPAAPGVRRERGVAESAAAARQPARPEAARVPTPAERDVVLWGSGDAARPALVCALPALCQPNGTHTQVSTATSGSTATP